MKQELEELKEVHLYRTMNVIDGSQNSHVNFL